MSAKHKQSALRLLLGLWFSISLTLSCSLNENNIAYGTPVTYEGETYGTVVIGSQTWMARNLNYNAEGSVCCGDDESNCQKYGRLYDWNTAMDLPPSCNYSDCSSSISGNHRGICPLDWHIPSIADWEVLKTAVGDSASKYLKATFGWNSYDGKSGNGEDRYGFAALPGGFGSSDGSFSGNGSIGYWWSSSGSKANGIYYRYMYRDFDYAYWRDKDNLALFSIRCVKD
jgi:uncharacterized protein (TIGR02145 family)